MSLALTDFAMRPAVGNSGSPIHIRTNSFEMLSFLSAKVHHYDITIDSENKTSNMPSGSMPPAINRRVWQTFVDTSGQSVVKSTRPVYDGRKNVFTADPLLLDGSQEEAAQFEVELQNNPASSSSIPRLTSGKFNIKIKKAGEINMEELHRFLERKSGLTPNCLTAIMALDVLIRHLPSITFDTVAGSSFFTPQGSRLLSNGVQVWQGYNQSVRPGVGRMFININLSATPFYESGSLPVVVAKILNRRTIDELRRGFNDSDQAKLEKFLKGVQVEVKHRGERKLKFKITALTPTSTDRTFFSDQNGNQQSVAHYFRSRYNMTIRYPFLPCVVVRQNEFLPMEACEIVPGQRYNKKLNNKQTAEMIKFTCLKPSVRANKISEGYNALQYSENPYLQQFGVTVKQEMATVKARVLNIPPITFSNTASTNNGSFIPQNGVWNLRNKKVMQGATLGAWSVVNFDTALPKPTIERFIREMCQTFINTGLNVINRSPTITNADPQGNIDRTLKEAWLKAGNQAKAPPQLILCILPNKGVSLYAAIKNVSDTVLGIATQCVQSRPHVTAAKTQYCANVCLKVNMKLGGLNACLSADQIPFISTRPTIVFGADVTHPTPGNMNCPSIAALTASMDARAARYSSAIRIQASNTEIITDLKGMVKVLLKAFYQTCGQKPQRMLFYRDGVSYGQFKTVLNEEIRAIHDACEELDKGYKPTVTFVVVQKRHHVRFFPIQSQDADQSTGNCKPGTVIDTDIVHPFEFDFYLLAHPGLQGTSRPTHYHVLHDENNFSADSLQELSYRLCYIYGRATRAVSLVPPLYYADLLASRARFHRKDVKWSDSEATSEVTGSEQGVLAYAHVKPELQRVMYYM